METTTEIKNTKCPINQEIKFKYIDDILYYDGPLISLGFTDDNTPVLQECVDMKEKYGLYAYVFIRNEDVWDLLEHKKKYYDVLKDSYRVVMFKYYQKEYDFEEIDVASFLENYGPEPDVSLHGNLQEFCAKLEDYIKTDTSLKAAFAKN